MSETPKVKFFIYLLISAGILLYAAVRLVMFEPRARRLAVYSDTGQIDEGVRRVLIANINAIREIPAEILERFPTIEHVSVRDGADGTVEVRIRHKKIVGLWTDGKNTYPLLENGTRLDTPYPSGARPHGLLLFLGPVPANVDEIIKIVQSYPELVKKVEFLTYVEGRRFNIKLDRGRDVLLPEQNVRNAVDRIKSLGILDKTFGVLDLRDPKRVLAK